jgi:DNA-binding transcriptional regulator YhcF (GntR family)
MIWNFGGSKPVYQQIKDRIRDAILAGEYPPGSRIPSVRELAADARVNPNTMQRALSDLEREQILVGCGTAGRSVTGDQTILEGLHRQAVEEALENCVRKFRALGLTPGQAAALLLQYEKTEDKTWTES